LTGSALISSLVRLSSLRVQRGDVPPRPVATNHQGVERNVCAFIFRRASRSFEKDLEKDPRYRHTQVGKLGKPRRDNEASKTAPLAREKVAHQTGWPSAIRAFRMTSLVHTDTNSSVASGLGRVVRGLDTPAEPFARTGKMTPDTTPLDGGRLGFSRGPFF
jgi:hypothetical protein